MAAKCSHSTTEAKYFPLICHPSEYILYKINALFTYIRPEGIWGSQSGYLQTGKKEKQTTLLLLKMEAKYHLYGGRIVMPNWINNTKS